MDGGFRGVATTAIRIVRTAVASAGPVLFPHFCLGCRMEGSLLCAACLEIKKASTIGGFSLSLDGALRPRPGPSGEAAPTLASPEGPGLERNATPFLVHVEGLDGVLCMAPYNDPLLRELLQAYKYEGIEEAGTALADLFAAFLAGRGEELRTLGDTEAVIVPSPLHPLRLRMRGFNQADVFAETLAAATGHAVDRTLLRRAYSSKTQVEMGESVLRSENVRGAVTSLRAAPESCVIVDDVMTTGSTLAACAKALRDAGALRVTAVTVLRG